MSFISKVSLEEAKAAKAELSRKLSDAFSAAAGGPVNGIGLTRISTAEWAVKVNLTRDLTEAEKKAMPKVHNGVKVVYSVVGPISPQ